MGELGKISRMTRILKRIPGVNIMELSGPKKFKKQVFKLPYLEFRDTAHLSTFLTKNYPVSAYTITFFFREGTDISELVLHGSYSLNGL
jgi:hypothetical protein